MVCPNILQYFNYTHLWNRDCFCIVSEFMDAGSVRDLQTRVGLQRDKSGAAVLPPDVLACITRQTLVGLDHLHQQGISHDGISRKNILIKSNGHVKITAPGAAYLQKLEELDRCVIIHSDGVDGSLPYMSPERCLGEDYNTSADIWSVGMVLYTLATGKHAFWAADTFPQLFELLCEKPEPRLDEEAFPADLYEFVASCLRREAHQRLTTTVLLEHPFLISGVPLEVYSVVLSDDDEHHSSVHMGCFDLGGTERYSTNLNANTDVDELGALLRDRFTGYDKVLDESGSSAKAHTSLQSLRDSGTSLTFALANTILVKFLASLNTS